MMANKKSIISFLLLSVMLRPGFSQTDELVQVVSKLVSRNIELPGEFLPFMAVSLHAKLPSYVDRVLVDRGSVVKKGELLVDLNAPEIAAQIAEAEAKKQAAEADCAQAESQLAAAQSTYERTQAAAQTPGAIAGNELIQAEKQRDSAQALVHSRQQASRAVSEAAKRSRICRSI